MSRTILERSALVHRILRSATAPDPAADFERGDEQRRHRIQTAYVHMLPANGPLRAGLTIDDAANTYGAFANPDTYALLTTRRGWTDDHYETWLRERRTVLLLNPNSETK